MANVELINLVTTKLIQQKKEIEFQLRKVVEETDVDVITTTLREYREVLNDVQLWETIINDINVPNEQTNGTNNE